MGSFQEDPLMCYRRNNCNARESKNDTFSPYAHLGTMRPSGAIPNVSI